MCSSASHVVSEWASTQERGDAVEAHALHGVELNGCITELTRSKRQWEVLKIECLRQSQNPRGLNVLQLSVFQHIKRNPSCVRSVLWWWKYNAVFWNSSRGQSWRSQDKSGRHSCHVCVCFLFRLSSTSQVHAVLERCCSLTQIPRMIRRYTVYIFIDR